MNTPTFPPQTAAQINFSKVGQVTISESDPGEETFPRAAVALAMEQDLKLSLKLPREKMIEAVKNAREIPIVWQEVLLAHIALIDRKHDLLQLDFISHAHKGGANFTGTVNEI